MNMQVETLDRANNHKDSLDKAIGQGRTPNKLSITIKPLVIRKDNPELVTKWERATKEAERKSMSVLNEHLTKITSETNTKIRQDTKAVYTKLKAIDKTKAKIALKEKLKIAEQERPKTKKRER